MATHKFPGRFDQLSKISEFVKQAASAAGLSEKEIYSVQLAVDEACSNIIDHSYGGEGKGTIICTCAPNEEGVTITLQDFGKPFDPQKIPFPDLSTDLEKVKVGGLGLYFIRKLMDDVDFQFSPDTGNILVMIKRKEKGS
jgi:serine/threonine-protein kinase RsbW